MKSTQQLLAQSRQRARLNQPRNGKIWIGGLVIGTFFGLFIGAVLLDLILIK